MVVTVNGEYDDPEFSTRTGNLRNQVPSDTLGSRKRKISERKYVDSPPPKRRKQSTPPYTTGSTSGFKKSRTISRDNFDDVIDLSPSPHLTRSVLPEVDNMPADTYSGEIGPDWKITHDPNMTVAQLNAKYRRQKESLKGLIAILSE
jgi:hypothetical protein